MPTLQLKVAPLLNPERYRALAVALTCLTVLHLGKREAVTAVVIDDLPAARWYIGGCDVQRATAQEKATFIAAAFEELQHQLGQGQALAPASYVIVRELPATDWGYGGQTQAARKLAKRPASAQAALPDR